MASAVASAEGATCVWGETLVITHACSAFHFYPREAMLVAFAYWLWPCVCVSVCLCPSVTSRSSIEAAERIELLVLDNGHGSFLLHCVKRNFEKNEGTSLWKFVQNCGLRKFCFDVSIVEACCWLGSRKLDAQSVINWTVVGQLSWQSLRAPTLDRCRLSHVLIELSLQHDVVARVGWRYADYYGMPIDIRLQISYCCVIIPDRLRHFA